MFRCAIIISLMLCVSACSKNRIGMILDDISRDTYENNVRAQRRENLGNPTYKEPPTYDEYQKERKKSISDAQPETVSEE